MTELVVSNATVRSGDAALVRDASFRLGAGELVVLLGPNGAGKTTLLRGALGLAALASGTATIGGKDSARLAPTDRARALAYLPQQRPLAWPAPVRDVVALGRYAHGAAIGRLARADAQAVDQAMADCDLTELAQRATDQLSGGEQARVHFARAMATQAPLLIADEPVASLDPHHQLRVMALIRGYTDKGGGALVVLHDITLAARFADRLLWMAQGQLKASGTVAETLSDARLAEIYQVSARVRGTAIDILGAL